MGPSLTAHYVGSSTNFRGSRWSRHKNSMLKGDRKDCIFCKHWAYYHKDDLQDLSGIQIYFIDPSEDPGLAEKDYLLAEPLPQITLIHSMYQITFCVDFYVVCMKF